MHTRLSARWLLWSIPVAAVALASWTTVSWAQEKKEEPKAKDIVDTAKADFKTLAKLIDAAGLAADWKGKGPFTLFAPTDDAWKKLGEKKLEDLQKPENKTELVKILKNQIVEGKKMAADLKGKIKTMAGNEVAIEKKDATTMVGAAKVTKADIAAANGVIHQTDTVIMPEVKPAEPPKKPEGKAPEKPEGKEKAPAKEKGKS